MDVPQSNGSTPDRPTPQWPVDAHGKAALLLVECLMHHLIDKRVITREDFIDIVDGAAEVECGEPSSHASLPKTYSRSLLYPLAASFRKELGT